MIPRLNEPDGSIDQNLADEEPEGVIIGEPGVYDRSE